MKTDNYKLLAAVLIISALSACQSDSINIEEIPGPQTDEELVYVSFEASSEQSGSKVYIESDNLTPTWSASDVIAVFDGSKRQFTITECSGSHATFSGSISSGYSGTLAAVYPYAAAGSRSDGSVTLTIPSAQKVADGYCVDQNALLATAACTDGSFAFKNVTGIVRFQIADSDTDVVSVTLTANGGEALAGTASVDFATGTISAFSNSSSTVTLSRQDGSALKPGVYFIAVAPAALNSGITLDFTGSSGSTASKTSTNTATVERSSGINLGDVTTGLSWEEDLGGGIIESDDVDKNDDDIVSNTTFDRTVKVIFSTSGDATVKNTGSNISASVSGNGVTITNSGKENVIYELSGSTIDGYFKLYSSKKQAIVLNGVSITNSSGAAINNQGTKRTYLVVRDGTHNALSDGSTYADSGDEDMKATLFSEGKLLFSGQRIGTCDGQTSPT